MKNTFLVLTLLAVQFGLIGTATADQFEIYDRKENKPVTNTKIKIDKKSYYSDSYGRVAIKLNAGSYQYKILHNGRKYSGTLKLDNARYLKKLYIE